MAGRLANLVADAVQRRNLKRWRNAAARADTLDPVSLRGLAARARQLGAELDLVLAKEEARTGRRAGAVPRPGGTDWAWRPDLWSMPVRPAAHAPLPPSLALSGDTKAFHDCTLGEATLRQIAAPPGSAAAHALALDVLGFVGSYLSLVVTLPDGALKGLARRHILRMEALITPERALNVYARLNIRHGPNTEQIARQMDLSAQSSLAEFDLGHAEFAESRVEGAWIDLIFEQPSMNRIVISDLTLTRGVRAEY
jgi:hypothetical protein